MPQPKSNTTSTHSVNNTNRGGLMVTSLHDLFFQTDFVHQLAIMGGQPAFAQPLHVGRPNIGDRAWFMAYAEQIFDNRWLTNNGPFVQQFEAELSRFLGRSIASPSPTPPSPSKLPSAPWVCTAKSSFPRSPSSPRPTLCNGRASRRSSPTSIPTPTRSILSPSKR